MSPVERGRHDAELLPHRCKPCRGYDWNVSVLYLELCLQSVDHQLGVECRPSGICSKHVVRMQPVFDACWAVFVALRAKQCDIFSERVNVPHILLNERRDVRYILKSVASYGHDRCQS